MAGQHSGFSKVKEERIMPGSRKTRPSWPFPYLLLLVAAAFAAGCSTANTTNGDASNANHLDASGNSVSGWVVVPTGGSHTSSATLNYTANGGSFDCANCHGSDLSGGISKVSCYQNPAGCHHDPVSGWVAVPPGTQNHGVSAKKAPGSSGFVSCQICHGYSFSGGGSQVSCTNTAGCHGAAAASPHPAEPWRGSPYTHTNVDPSNAPVCAQCHFPGSPNNPANHPAAQAPAGTPPGCFNNTLCHGTAAEAPHPVPYNDSSHYTVTTATFPANCGTCHAVTGTSPVSAAPLCTTCHVAASPLTSLNCTSCHASPPSGGAPAGAAYPNVPGAHATHIALNSAGTPIACDTCHNGLGGGTLNHYNRANNVPGENALHVPPGDAAFLTTYNAKTGASLFDNSAALNCSNVSCHGGQATPNWQTGTLDVNTQCKNCHALGTAQYNSYYSGEHQFHVVDEGLACTICHNTTTLAVNHFTTLETTTMEGPASATIGGTDTAITSWDPTTKSCTPLCHGARIW